MIERDSYRIPFKCRSQISVAKKKKKNSTAKKSKHRKSNSSFQMGTTKSVWMNRDATRALATNWGSHQRSSSSSGGSDVGSDVGSTWRSLFQFLTFFFIFIFFVQLWLSCSMHVCSCVWRRFFQVLLLICLAVARIFHRHKHTHVHLREMPTLRMCVCVWMVK